jgi:hypothetical protein
LCKPTGIGEKIQLKLEAEKPVKLTMHNSRGEQVFPSCSQKVQSNSVVITLHLAGLAKGIYFLQLKSDEYSFIKMFHFTR